MAKQDWTLSDLLAHRDGQPLDVERAQALRTDGDARRTLEEIDALQKALTSLPDVAVDDEVWLRPETASRPSGRMAALLRFPMATAASIFVASTLFIVYLLSAPDGVGQREFAALPPANPTENRLLDLMNRSRDLELRLRGGLTPALGNVSTGRPAAPKRSTRSLEERQLLYRLADVDAEIARLYDGDTVDAQARERLWRQRVGLLENLVFVRGGTAVNGLL
jgi:hypothetical protein